MRKNKKSLEKDWPMNCIWPEPVEDGEGHYWESESADFMPLDEIGEDLQDIKDYMDSLVEEELLNEDYTLNPDYAEFTPEKCEDYWCEDGFDFDSWNEDMVNHLNNLKLPLPSPVDDIQRIIGYEFINENLLRQAFTRRSFGHEHAAGDSEVLEFYGDSALNTVITREMARQTAEVDTSDPCSPFTSHYNEGELTRIRQHYASREYLAARAEELGLDKFILYGTGEEATEAAKEDMMEALIGAVAVDSEWDWYALEAVVDRLICLQVSKEVVRYGILRPSCYDLFNSWHQRKFGRMPDYEMSKGMPVKNGLTGYRYLCTLRYSIPGNDKGVWTSQRVDVQRETRSKAREYAAREAYEFVVHHGLWMNLADAGLEPNLENSINQLQELYQKKYVVDKPEYSFTDMGSDWRCVCVCNGMQGIGQAKGKTQAKKKAAFVVLVLLLKSAGLSTDEMERAMYRTFS